MRIVNDQAQETATAVTAVAVQLSRDHAPTELASTLSLDSTDGQRENQPENEPENSPDWEHSDDDAARRWSK